MKPRFSLLAFLVTATAYPTRKSLGFGPHHPTARYVTRPDNNCTLAFTAEADPLDVARAFIHSLTESDYYIRNDSYTDENTRITHVYARQLFHGLEVADGNINLNIRHGRVLSFGDSFCRGLALPLDAYPSTSLASFCADFAAQSFVLSRGSQSVLSERSKAMKDWFSVHCARPLAAVQQAAMADMNNDVSNPRRAALYFMIAAHPDPLVVDQLVREFRTIIANMTTVHEYITIGLDTHQSTTLSDLPGTVNPIKVRMVYIQIPTGNTTALLATWRLEVEMAHNWYEAYVSVHDPSAIVSVIDWASDSSAPSHGGYLNALEAKLDSPRRYTEAGAYKVWRWGINDPESGERTVESASYDPVASPLGWHAIPRRSNPDGSPDWIGKGAGDGAEYLNFTTTWGNNVFAHENWKGSNEWISNYRPEGGENLGFTFEYEADGDYKNYVDFSITQLFYTSNMLHDLYYRYGFDERAGNFQQDNFNRGGRGNDSIIASVQDGDGFNNAYFAAGPDGQHGRCRMHLWNTATPYRDASLDAGIVIHELTHGLSSRLTGGPDNAGCLPWGESAGMGEGWSDFLATTIRSTEDYHDYATGSWVSNHPGGIRKYPYSKDISVNPSMYSTIDDPEVSRKHDIGEVWAEILWVVSQKMIEKHGYSPTLFPPAPMEDSSIPLGDFYKQSHIKGGPLVPKHGNTLMVQLAILGMKLQPCRPSFIQARDAIIHADQILTGGENACILWAGFSSRGLASQNSSSMARPV
ncbi:extracellular elastinolytic metalloproteinase [Rhizoctonia solani 123E]|uniref:Extracellular metalloproteinase n=1 Tax=Rhizoctonia solani 123E TaxID=1423351 RepID=A0A074RMZ8_9AGAM|nr:extracellular elastinolytic metalloproteinase [Rhizoctonia solani 123E]